MPDPFIREELQPTMRLAGPVVAAQLAQVSMGFVDTVMVGRLGPEALAGVALGNTVFFTLLIVCSGTIQAVGPMVSQAFGADEHEPIARSVRQGLWLGVFLAVPAMLGLYYAEPLLRAAGQEPAAVEGAASYLRAICWGFLPACWFTALRSFVEGLSRPLPVTIITLGGVALNVGANAVLMYGYLGAPALGIVGTGWATTAVLWTLFGLLALITGRLPTFRPYHIFQRLRTPDPVYLKELVRIGVPMGLSRGIEAGMFMITALMVGTLGTTALAAHQVALQCAAFTFMVPVGVSIAGAVRVGQAAGRGTPDGARRAGYAAMLLATAFMVAAAAAFRWLPEPIVALYLDVTDPANQEVVRLAVTLLGVAAVFQVFDGIQVAASGALQGLKDTRVPMGIALLSYWGVGLTAGYVLGFRLGGGTPGLWWGLVIGLAVASVILFVRFRHIVPRAVRERSISAGDDLRTPEGEAAPL